MSKSVDQPPKRYGESVRRWRLINDFARRCFRDMADKDYIAARSCYRASLWPQFLWMALQAVEKYLKGILLYNRVPSKNVMHDLSEALNQARLLPFDLELSEAAQRMLRYLDQPHIRYLEASYAVHGPKLVELDRLVWELRRYCQVLDFDIIRSDGERVSFCESMVKHVEEAAEEPHHKFRIRGGYLEKVIDNRNHPAREDLIWKNLFFGLRHRKAVQMKVTLYAENAPLGLHPEILDDVLEYVYLPGPVVRAYREAIEKRQAEETDDSGTAEG